MPSRNQRAQIAADTVRILHAGEYVSPLGETVSIADALQVAIDQTQLIDLATWPSIEAAATEKLKTRRFKMRFRVANEATLVSAERLVNNFGHATLSLLNFASARNPRGGFLNGSQAQEESLARASGLHACLERQMSFYEAHRNESSLLYSDRMIFSPAVPVIRDAEDRLAEKPWCVGMLTAAAPNAGAVEKNTPALAGQIEPTFRQLIERLLTAAVAFDQTALVLGAWGCGVFGNRPEMVATLFAEQLRGSGKFARAFDRVDFAVLDSSGEIVGAFVNVFE